MAKVSLKLVVDKDKNRVVFAEADNDFVDILFSFLTLPMGTIIGLLGKNSEVGCMDKLYECIENLDTKYFQTKACQTMLLHPRNASRRQLEDLKINVDDPNPRQIYKCPKWDCHTKTHRLFSNTPDARCACGQVMDGIMVWLKRKVDTSNGGNIDGVFVKGAANFMITDDLHVNPISTVSILSLLQENGIGDANTLEKRTVDVGKDEVLSLLKRMLLSRTPLTDVFLRKPGSVNCGSDTDEAELIDVPRVKEETEEKKGTKVIRVQLLERKYTKKVVYAEAGEDFVDILFSFLTFPLGTIVKLLNKHSGLRCADNLYQSVENLSLVDGTYDFIKSEECKNMLLEPKLPTHFGCSNQLLVIGEKQFTTSPAWSCETCFNAANLDKCLHGLQFVTMTKINPKLPIPGTEHGGGFAKTSLKFMVTNRILVAPLLPTIVIDTINELKVPITRLVQTEITFNERELLSLLKSCLTSNSLLSNAFSRKKQRKMK